MAIQHPRHEHPLDLQVYKGSKEFGYHCVKFYRGCCYKLDAGTAMKTLLVEKYYCSMLQEAGDGQSRLQFAHEHPLTSFPATRKVFCRGCKMEISEEEAYGCRECNFFLHEACAKAPQVVENHPFHPEHRLHLRCRPGDLFRKTEDPACRICETRSSIGYSCHNCKFFLDLSCVISIMACEDDEEREDSRKRSPSSMNRSLESLHRHQLSSYHSKTQTKIKCDICDGHIPSGDFFGCSDCTLFLHASCAQPPMEIQHYLHPEHTLTFAKCPGEKEHQCPICEYPVRSEYHCYTCEMCDFFIHQTCASATLSDLEKEVGRTVQCSFHEHVELKLYYNDGFFENCAVCERTIEGKTLAYRCFSQGCSFKIHKPCANLPSNLAHPSHLLHPLTLRFKPPNEDEDIECRCCDKGISGLFAFSCGECNFYLHVACAQKPTWKHPFHEHDLFHFAYLEKGSRPNKSKCGACLKRCSYDFLCCAQCDFTLHYYCSQLPSTMKSEHYWEPLVLHDSYIEDDSGEYYCDICEKRRDPNKWVYCSEAGNYQLIAHVECALSPVKLEVIEEDEFIRREEDIQRKEEQIRLAQEEVDAKEVSLRPLMVELESMRAKLDSQMADLEEMKTELAKWINEEATGVYEHIRGEEDVNATDGESARTDGEQQDDAAQRMTCTQQ
ncbi:uncharacterized protein LOC115750074 [Rhodamnia argentea]|uniref:Uncharacterized protein LOC115750074 n=1 Tax=Rhodamnia argentea TaxID=178133 RepID=A0A8B8Q990_9MYRT|nr:uncharacterized protein LOC115750074 [Rhodamnia argentea]